MNVHLVKERVSMSSIFSPWWRFNIIRNLSFILSWNKIDLADRILYPSDASKSTSMTVSWATGFAIRVSEFFIWFNVHATVFSVLATDLASVCHSWEFHFVSPYDLPVLASRSFRGLLDLEFPALEDAVEDGTIEIHPRLLETKFLTGLDLATTLSSQSLSCDLFDMAW